MEKGNFVYSGWRANGFVALVGLLVLIAGGIALCVFGSDVMDPRIGLRTAMLVCGVCLFFISMFCFKGFMLLEPNEARVVMFFGKYKGTFYETGFWWYEGENETYIEASVENSSSILYDKEIRNKPRTRRTKRNV